MRVVATYSQPPGAVSRANGVDWRIDARREIRISAINEDLWVGIDQSMTLADSSSLDPSNPPQAQFLVRKGQSLSLPFSAGDDLYVASGSPTVTAWYSIWINA